MIEETPRPPRAAERPAGVKADAGQSEGMSYLSTLPQRLVQLYLPLSIIVIVLLFPFYWMVITAVKPKEHLPLGCAIQRCRFVE